jgi:hypothetical protein
VTPHNLRDRARKAMQTRSDETALINGRSHSRTLEEQRYHAGVSDGLLAAIEILNETLKTDDDEDD